VLQQLPKDAPSRPKYIALLKEMAAESLAIQGKDGLWRPGMLDEASYPLPEVSGSAFVAYALAYGVNQGILDRKSYWPAVEKAWAGMLMHVYATDGWAQSSRWARLPVPSPKAPATFTAWVLICWPGRRSIARQSKFLR